MAAGSILVFDESQPQAAGKAASLTMAQRVAGKAQADMAFA